MDSPDIDLKTQRSDYRAAARRLLCGAQNHGVSLERILQTAEMDPVLFADEQTPIKLHQFVRLLRASTLLLDDEFFGLTQRRIKQGTLSMMVDLALGCATLGAAIEKVVDFYRIVTDDLEIYCEQQGDDMLLGIRLSRPELDPSQFLADYWLLYLHRFFSWMTGLLIPIRHVLSTAVEGEQRLVRFIREDWQSGQHRDAWLISRKYWTLPVIRTRSEWQDNVDHLVLNGVLSWPDGTQQYANQVRALMLKTLISRQPPPRLQEIAQGLNLTAQTLHRHLQNEGTGYQRLRDDLRRDFAIDLLSKQHQSISGVAEQLGFAEPRSFSRAFKQWTGRSPSSVRKL